MTDFDQFEHEFAAALRSDADLSVAPFEPTQVARAAMADGRRRTAGVAFPLFGRATRGPARRSGRGRGLTLLAAALVLVGAAAMAGSGLLRLPSLLPPSTTVATASPAVESSGPIITPSPAPTEAGLPAQPGQFASVTDFGLASATVGWVSTASALYRTENFGQTWSAVTPPGWPTASFSGSGRMTSNFIDADTAYTYLPGTPGTIAVSHDGGATWEETALAGTTADSQPSFRCQTSTSGSLIFWGANKTDPSRVFDTADGGSTWTGPHAGPSEREAGPSGYLVLGCLQVRTLTPPGDTAMANRLQVSHDAGATWIDRTLPVGPQAPASKPSDLVDKQVIAAWGDTGGRIVMALNVSSSRGSFDQIYTSLDDGRSWEYLQIPAPLHFGGSTQFLSATEWILVAEDASRFMSTLDGGATWRTTAGSSPFEIGPASFSSPDLGWAVPNCGFFLRPRSVLCDQGFSGLLQTTDGGRTWTQLGK